MLLSFNAEGVFKADNRDFFANDGRKRALYCNHACFKRTFRNVLPF